MSFSANHFRPRMHAHELSQGLAHSHLCQVGTLASPVNSGGDSVGKGKVLSLYAIGRAHLPILPLPSLLLLLLTELTAFATKQVCTLNIAGAPVRRKRFSVNFGRSHHAAFPKIVVSGARDFSNFALSCRLGH